MPVLQVQVEGDFLESISRVAPLDALTELIWNSLDAEAHRVQVRLHRNGLGGIEGVTVEDDGHGISYEDALAAFQKLGGSWKKAASHSKNKVRRLHGKQGRGRYRAFAIGDRVVWSTRYSQAGGIRDFAIEGERSQTTMTVSTETIDRFSAAGTRVDISRIPKQLRSLEPGPAIKELTPRFALYLSRYRGIQIGYDSLMLDPASVMGPSAELPMRDVDLGVGPLVNAVLTVIEWKIDIERSLSLCDADGFSLDVELSPSIHAAGFNFTAYLRAEILRQFQLDNVLTLGELHPPLAKLVEAARGELRRYFGRRKEERRALVVEQWKEQGVYPFEGDPTDAMETARRQVFDVVALNIEETAPEIASQPTTGKKFAFRLLKETLNTQPTVVRAILKDVLGLGREKQEELAELIRRVSLEGVINLTKLVADRLAFLKDLRVLVFEEPHRSALKERTQLQRLLADNTWLFLESYHLSAEDEGLTKVLQAHRALLGECALPGEPPVRDADGKKAVVDFMLSRAIPQGDPVERHHLIVEIKRPDVPVSFRVMEQVVKYAEAIRTDERFRDVRTKWDFWAVSNDIDEMVRTQTRQKGLERGVFSQPDTGEYRIWAKSWGQIIQEAEARHKYLAETLRFSSAANTELEYVRKEYEKYLPTTALDSAASPEPPR